MSASDVNGETCRSEPLRSGLTRGEPTFSEATARRLIEQADDGIFLADEQGHFVLANPKACALTGYSETELLSLHVKDLSPGSLRESIFSGLNGPLSSLPSRFEHDLYRKDGCILPVEVSITRRTDGLMQGIVRDISSRRIADLELKRLKRDLQERVKEQTCLSDCSRILQDLSSEPAALLQTLVERIPTGWRFPELAAARITFPAGFVTSRGYHDSPLRQEASFSTSTGSSGKVELCYSGRPPEFPDEPFLSEEQTLLESIADALRMYFEARDAVSILRLREQHFRVLTENALDSIVTLDAQGITLYASPGIKRLLGWSPEERIGRTAFELVHPDDQPRIAEIFTSNLQNANAIVSTEYRHLHKDGSWRIIASIARNSLHDPAVRAVIINSRDVTERRVAEEALRRSEERFRLATRATHEVIWERDVKSGEMWWSENLRTLGWYDDPEVQYTFDWLVSRVHPEDRLRVSVGIASTLAAAESFWSAEHRILRRDGGIAQVFNRAYIVYDPEGAPLRMIGSLQDMTEKRQLEAQFLRAQRLESIGSLASGVAHDLNNILAPILMGSQLLQETCADPGSLELLESIQKSAERGADIIRQLLTFARGAEGEKHPIQLRHFLRDMLKIVRETFPKNITVSLEAEGELPAVEANLTQLHQVLLNLCVNARDAMPEGGNLQITAGNCEVDAAFVSTHPEAKSGHYIRIAVADTGIGMPPELHVKIFEPFFSTKAPHQGTGLGLSTVIGIVKNHNGFVLLQSEPGKGSEFSVYLPALCEAGASRHPSASHASLPCGSGETILLVDDEDAIRETAGATLRNHGYRVRTARNGAEALKVLDQFQREVNLLLTDLRMPVMDGTALVRTVRQTMPRLRIIVSSGVIDVKEQDNSSPVGELRSLGVTTFIAKPYRREDLLATIARLLA